MKDGPLLFNQRSARLIVEGLKTQTRRVMRKQPPPETVYLRRGITGLWVAFDEDEREVGWEAYAPFDRGDIIWGKETWFFSRRPEDWGTKYYRADNPSWYVEGLKWNPSIFMPRLAARLILPVTAQTKGERLQDISPEDAMAEGAPCPDKECPGFVGAEACNFCRSPVGWYSEIWAEANPKGPSWKDNPWVWVYEFRRRK